MLGEVVGNFRITAKLAEGGMGAVYRAEHPLLGKTAAVKVLLPELSNNRELVNRFFTEARSATAVRHPGIVEIYDFGYLPSGAAYIVMELLDGQSLSLVLVARGRLTEQEALIYTRGIASALAAAHAQGIVHRDLKPDNIFLVRDPDMIGGLRPKILDFGIAKVAEAQRVGGATSKTRTGAVMGTPTYMSPEQCRGVGEVDHRSDLYSVGCILYEMLVGRPPFSSEGVGELLAMHQFMAPMTPTEAGVVVSQAAELLVLQLLQKRPEDRVQSAADLARLLGHGSLPAIANPGAPAVAGVVMATPPPVLPTPAPIRITAGPPAASAPTTLSSAVGAGTTGAGIAAAPGRSSRTFLFAGIGVVLAAGAGTAILLAGGGTSASSPAGAAAVVASPPVGAAQVAPPIDATPPADAAPPIDAPIDAPVDAAIVAPTGPAKRTTTYRGNKSHVQSSQGSGRPSVDRGD
ncbi:MAG TPA: serine/threonine-protein kinase [Kofleriaceae bacterium]|nr:serine/threonine-protein kinase [Kofleriaceae bacterium]